MQRQQKKIVEKDNGKNRLRKIQIVQRKHRYWEKRYWKTQRQRNRYRDSGINKDCGRNMNCGKKRDSEKNMYREKIKIVIKIQIIEKNIY